MGRASIYREGWTSYTIMIEGRVKESIIEAARRRGLSPSQLINVVMGDHLRDRGDLLEARPESEIDLSRRG